MEITNDLTNRQEMKQNLSLAPQQLAALSLLRGEKDGVAEPCDVPLTRDEAASLLRVSRTTVTTWGKQGIIRRMAIPGRRKALGYSRRSVMAILNGNGENGEGE